MLTIFGYFMLAQQTVALAVDAKIQKHAVRVGSSQNKWSEALTVEDVVVMAYIVMA